MTDANKAMCCELCNPPSGEKSLRFTATQKVGSQAMKSVQVIMDELGRLSRRRLLPFDLISFFRMIICTLSNSIRFVAVVRKYD